MNWGSWSDHLFGVAVSCYALAMLFFAAEFAFAGRGLRAVAGAATRRRGAPEPVVAAPVAARQRVLVGAGGPALPATEQLPAADAVTVQPARVGGGGDVVTPAVGGVSRCGRLAVGLTASGWVAHLASVATRAVAAHRVPWGNMYEFASLISLVAVTAYLVLLTRARDKAQIRGLGGFVLLPVVCYMGLAGTVLYSEPGPLVPALNSYWIKIHVVAAIVSSGCLIVSGATTALYLLKSRYVAAVEAGRTPRGGGIARRLPALEALDRTAYRVTAFAFPIWTFAIIAGAIWAEAAWGRYWGWDPKETWSFITWCVYAGYLHARATAGWKGRKAAWIALAGFGCLAFDFFGVNIWITGLHSYAGL